jgi:hypothetical protein
LWTQNEFRFARELSGGEYGCRLSRDEKEAQECIAIRRARCFVGRYEGVIVGCVIFLSVEFQSSIALGSGDNCRHR